MEIPCSPITAHPVVDETIHSFADTQCSSVSTVADEQLISLSSVADEPVDEDFFLSSVADEHAVKLQPINRC